MTRFALTTCTSWRGALASTRALAEDNMGVVHVIGSLTHDWWKSPLLALNLERAADFHPSWQRCGAGHIAAVCRSWRAGSLPRHRLQRSIQAAALQEWWISGWPALVLQRWQSFTNDATLSIADAVAGIASLRSVPRPQRTLILRTW